MGQLGVIPPNIQWLSFILVGHIVYGMGMTTGDLGKAKSPSEFLLTFSGLGMNIFLNIKTVKY